MMDKKQRILTLDDTELGLWMCKQLMREKDLLIIQDADEAMISAIDQALLDDEQWISSETEASLLKSPFHKI